MYPPGEKERDGLCEVRTYSYVQFFLEKKKKTLEAQFERTFFSSPSPRVTMWWKKEEMRIKDVVAIWKELENRGEGFRGFLGGMHTYLCRKGRLLRGASWWIRNLVLQWSWGSKEELLLSPSPIHKCPKWAGLERSRFCQCVIGCDENALVTVVVFASLFLTPRLRSRAVGEDDQFGGRIQPPDQCRKKMMKKIKKIASCILHANSLTEKK